MIIILPLGRSVKQYLQWVVNQRRKLVLHCPSCSCLRLHGHDHYERWAVTRLSLHRIPIHRWHCPRCQKTVSVLPDLLVPYGRFVNNLREQAVRRVEVLAAELSNWLVELILQIMPHLDIYALSSRHTGARANLRFLLDLGAYWCRLFPLPIDAHPGFFAALSRCRDAPGFL